MTLNEAMMRDPSLADMFACQPMGARERADLYAWLQQEKGIADPSLLSEKMLDAYAAEKVQSDREKALAEERAKRVEEWLDRVVPKLHRDRCDEDFDYIGKTYASILNGRTAIIIGNNGCGKTGLAYAVLMHDARAGERSTKVISAIDLLADLKRQVYNSRYSPTTVIAMDYGKYVKRLFIDEIDKIAGTDADFGLLLSLIDYRYQWQLQTVAISNLPLDQVRDIIGQSSYSRLTCEPAISMPYKNWRRKDS